MDNLIITNNPEAYGWMNIPAVGLVSSGMRAAGVHPYGCGNTKQTKTLAFANILTAGDELLIGWLQSRSGYFRVN